MIVETLGRGRAALLRPGADAWGHRASTCRTASRGLRARPSTSSLSLTRRAILAARALTDRGPRQWTPFPDLGALSDEELKDLIQQLTEEEQEVSYQRRILHGKIDILRAELVNRLRKKHEEGEAVISGADVQQLTDILAGKGMPGDPTRQTAASGAEADALPRVRLRQRRGRELLPEVRRVPRRARGAARATRPRPTSSARPATSSRSTPSEVTGDGATLVIRAGRRPRRRGVRRRPASR